MDIKRKTYNKLRGYLAEHRISMNNLAMYLNITRVSLWNKLNGKRKFKPSEIKAMKIAFGLTKEQVIELFFTD